MNLQCNALKPLEMLCSITLNKLFVKLWAPVVNLQLESYGIFVN